MTAAAWIIPDAAEEAIQPDRRHKFLTTRRYPIYALTITKCGCTFLKNLLYYLDHDRLHPQAECIHDFGGDLVRAGDVPGWMIRDSRYAFTVLRNPVDRLVSMYFDKIVGTGPQNFGSLRQEIAAEAGLDLSKRLDVAAHRQNLQRLVPWLKRNLEDRTSIPINPHWRPQTRRVETVAQYKPGKFTLEGLDWQMPQYLSGVIPDLAERIAAVKARNVTQYPVAPAEVLTPDLTEEIAALYAEDHAAWDKAHRGWEKRKGWAVPPTVPNRGHVINPLTTRMQAFNVIAQPKAGCSYVRNVVYAMDHGRAHPMPERIVADDCLITAEKDAAALRRAVNVVVLRDPVARFFSFYFDKVWGDSAQSFPWISRRLFRHREFLTGRDLSVPEHRENCRRLVRFLAAQMQEQSPDDQNPHWRPQIHKANWALTMGFVPVMLEQFGQQVGALSAGRLKGFDHALDVTAHKNASTKPVAVSSLIDPWLQARISALYAEDIALYDRVRSEWTAIAAGKAIAEAEWPDGKKDAPSTDG